jgi:hypothetical protein
MCFLIMVLMITLAGKAQTASLEFASGGGPAGTGPSLANQVVTFKNNTDNPIGNTFVPYNTPTITTTFSLSNQQYTVPTSELSTGYGVCFGAAINNSGSNALPSTLYPLMNAISAAPSNDFTSVNTLTPGTGISVTNNYSTEILCSGMPLYHANASTTGRFYYGDLTITFSSLLSNPIIHIVGIGAFSGSQGFTTELELQTLGVTLSKLSGSPELNVTSNKILNSSATPSSGTGSGAASGSILVSGMAVSKLVFKLYVRGDGGGPWATSTSHSGDQWLIGVSTAVVNIVLPLNLTEFTATPQSGKTQLQWTTATENNTNYFDIQYSTDQLSWQSIGTVRAAGNSNTERSYSFVHADPASGTNYYRLKIVEADGQSFWSGIRMLSFGSALQLNYYPNPTKNGCTITTNGRPLASVAVIAVDGRQLQRINNFVSGASVDLSQYPHGIYFIAVKDDVGNTQILKVLKD